MFLFCCRSFQLSFYNKYLAGNPKFAGMFDWYGTMSLSNLTSDQLFAVLGQSDLLSRNFLRLTVLFERRGIEVENSTAAMTWDGLASNVGGSLSLWVGVTVMTLFELVELAYFVVTALVRRRRQLNPQETKTT